jgi:hypothetical protein
VIERELTIPNENSLPPVWLDLDGGKEISLAGFPGDLDEPPGFAVWLKNHGADLSVGNFVTAEPFPGENSPPSAKRAPFFEHGFFTMNEFGLRAMPVKPELWDAADAKALLALSPALAAQADSAQTRKLVPDGQSPENPKGRLPATFFFKTAEGNLGLIQILDFPDAMRRVKLRYKLVQGGEPKTAATAAPATTPTFAPIVQCFIATGKTKQSFYSIERNAYVEAPLTFPQIPRFEDQSAEAKAAREQYAKWLADNALISSSSPHKHRVTRTRWRWPTCWCVPS